LAAWLRSAPGLSDVAVGELLASPGPLCEGALRHYVAAFELDDLPIERAIRKVLGSFRLPGEAQKIGRVMEAFADVFFAHGGALAASDARSAGAAFVLAFAVVMLNTDAHNANVKEKMTFGQFVENNANLNDGANFEERTLRRIFDDVTSYEI
ncbi:Sec7 domain-containing protein, partial [Pavlovales sp. CCMP2436]